MRTSSGAFTDGSPAGKSPACPGCHATADGAPAASPLDPGWLAHLYECQQLSTYQIAARAGVSRRAVTRALRAAGVTIRPRGAGRVRPLRRTGDPPGLPGLLQALYTEGGLDSRQVAEALAMPERTVRDRLRRYGIPRRTRGGWNREDRADLPAAELRRLYREAGMTAAQAGAFLGCSADKVLRAAHAHGLPVRSGGAVALPGPREIELLAALYADPLVDAVLTAHGISRVPAGGPVAVRFPAPVPLTTPLVKDLYWGCGAGLNHIELLTGQAAGSVRGYMRREGIGLRPPGGRSPFLRRWRAQAAARARGATPA